MNIKDLGDLMGTAAVNELAKNNKSFLRFLQRCLKRYICHDWGDVSPEDFKTDDQAVKSGEDRILAAYDFPKGVSWNGEGKIWIITEWDHSVTTILFPSEY